MVQIMAMGDTPLTRLQRDYEQRLAVKDRELERAADRMAAALLKERMAQGTIDAMKLQIADLLDSMAKFRQQAEQAERNLKAMLAALPDRVPDAG